MKRSRIFAVGGFAAFAAMSVEARGAETLLEALRGLAPSSIVSERIVGGDPTSQSEWPWQNALYFRGPDGHQYFDCGGSLIAPNWVLTAAHCFAGTRKPEDWTVVTNIAKISADGIPEGSLQRKVARVVVHEQYDTESHANDIALLQLAEPLPNTTISLQLTGDKTIEGADRSVTVVGWGRTRWLQQKKDAQGNSVWIDGMTQQQVNPSNFQSPELRKASIPLVDVEKCAKMEQGIKGVVVDARVLCAGLPEGGRDSCQGDSGGPLMSQIDSDHWRQIGVVSVGIHCGEVKLPGVYTRVSAFGDWIRGVVGGDLVVAAQTPSAPGAQPTSPPDAQAAPAPAPAKAPISDPALDNAAGLTIAFEQGDDVKVGDIVDYRATTQKPGYLAIFDATPDGKLTQIYPNALSLRSPTGTLESTRMDPTRPVVVPNYKNPYRGFNVRITEPRGEGTMVAVLSEKPISALDTPDKPKTFATPQAARAAIRRIHDELARNLQIVAVGEGHGKADKAGPAGSAGHIKAGAAGSEVHVNAGIQGHPDWSIAIHKYTIH